MIDLPTMDTEPTEPRTERVSTYVEMPLLKAYEEYAERGGFRSVSEVIRRLTIIGLDHERGIEARKRASDDGVNYDGC